MPAYVTSAASGKLASYDGETMVAMFVDADGKAAIEAAALANGTVNITNLSELTSFELARTTFTAEADETLGKIDVAADENPTADTDGETVAGIVIARQTGGSDSARTVVACHTFTARAGNTADAVVFSNENGFATWEPAPGNIVRGIGLIRPDAEGIINPDALAASLDIPDGTGGGGLAVDPDSIETVTEGEHVIVTQAGGTISPQMVAVQAGDTGEDPPLVSLPPAVDCQGQIVVVTGTHGSVPIGIVERDDTPAAGYMNSSAVMAAIVTAAGGGTLDLTTATLGSALIPKLYVDGTERSGAAVDASFDLSDPDEITALALALFGHVIADYGVTFDGPFLVSGTTGVDSEVRISPSMATVAGVDLTTVDGNVPGGIGRIRSAADGTAGLSADAYYDDTEWQFDGAFATHNIPNGQTEDHKATVYVSTRDESTHSLLWGGWKWSALVAGVRLEHVSAVEVFTAIDAPNLRGALWVAENGLVSMRLVTATLAAGDETVTLTSGTFDEDLDEGAVVAVWDSTEQRMKQTDSLTGGHTHIASVTSGTVAELEVPALTTGSIELAIARPLNALVEYLLTTGGGTGPDLSDADPEALGTVDSGTSADAARSDHVHPLPSKATLGVGGIIAGQDEGATVSATTTETTLLDSTPTVTAAAGEALRITAGGTCVQNSGGSASPTLRFKLGGSTVLTFSASLANSATTRPWEATATIRVQANGDANASGTCMMLAAVFDTDIGTHAGDLSAGQALDVTWQHPSATNCSAEIAYLLVERVRSA